MSHEVFQMISNLDAEDIGTQLILQCAPLLGGLKTSNLLIIPEGGMAEVQRLLRNSSISYYVLSEHMGRETILLYRKEQLMTYLQESKVQAMLQGFGYLGKNFGEILSLFRLRYQSYVMGTGSFPHEMGLLLGYPAEDVEGFICNKGRNSLCTGYWKVYQNPVAKKQLFQRFEWVSEAMIRLMLAGTSVSDIIHHGSTGLLLGVCPA